MKAILFLAVFALAASAAHVNLTALAAGFVDQLQLNRTAARDAQNCNVAAKTVLADVQKLTNATTPEAVALAALSLYNNVKNKLAVDCVAFSNDLSALAHTNAKNNTALKALIERNLERYAPQLIQQVTVLIDAIASGNDYQVGHTEAYILQILLGLETPATLPVNQFNYSKYQPINQERLFAETYKTYFTRIGMDNVTINNTLQCFNTLPNATQSLIVAINGLSNQSTIEQSLNASKAVYAQFINTITPCVSAYRGVWNFNAPTRNLFLNAPGFFVLTFLHNVGLNLPKINQIATNQSVNLFQGEYTQAGEAMAQLYKIVYANLV